MVYEITSGKTGQNYRVSFDQPPSEADVDEAVSYFDTEAARAAGVDPEVLNQGPLGTFARGVPQELAKVGTGAIQGAADIIDKTSQSGLFSGGPLGFLSAAMRPAAQQAAGVAADLEDAADAAYPTNPFNAKAQTVASGFGQGAKLVAGGAIGKAAGLGDAALVELALVSGGLSGVHEGVTKAEDIGVESPEAQIAMGLLFGTVEAGTEKMFGFGNKGATEALLNQFKQPAAALLKQAAKSIGGEAVEEIAAGSAQDLLTRAFADEDPANPGFTRTGVELPKLDRKMLERRGLEALGGAAGGTVFAGAQTLANAAAAPAPQPVPDQPLSRVFTRRDGSTTTLAFDKEPTPQDLAEAQAWLDQQPNDNLPPARSATRSVAGGPNQTATPPGTAQAPGAPTAAPQMGGAAAAPVSPLIGIAQRAGAVDVDPLLPESTGDLTAEDVADLEPEVSSSRFQVPRPILQGMPDRAAPFRDNPFAAAQEETGNLITDLRIPRSPQAIAQSQQQEQDRLAQQAKLRNTEAKTGRGPVLPESTGDLTAEDVQDLETQNLPLSSSSETLPTVANPDPAQTITGSNVQTGTEMPVPPPTADAGAGAGAPGVVNQSQSSYLDRVLDAAIQDESMGELTIPVPEKNQNRDDLDKAVAVIEARGLNAASDGKSILVRGFRELRRAAPPPSNPVSPSPSPQVPARNASRSDAGRSPSESSSPTGLTHLIVKRDLESGFMTTAGADALLDLAHRAFTAGQTFVQWSKTMLQRFGESIRQWLAGAWDHAKRSSQTGAVNFTGRLGSDLQRAAQQAKGGASGTAQAGLYEAVQQGDLTRAAQIAAAMGFNVGPVFHGTTSGNRLETLRTEHHAIHSPELNTRLGAMFAVNRSASERFATGDIAKARGSKNGRVIASFLNIKNPLEFETTTAPGSTLEKAIKAAGFLSKAWSKTNRDRIQQRVWKTYGRDTSIEARPDLAANQAFELRLLTEEEMANAFKSQAIAAGYDGIYVKQDFSLGPVWIAFREDQIKLVDLKADAESLAESGAAGIKPKLGERGGVTVRDSQQPEGAGSIPAPTPGAVNSESSSPTGFTHTTLSRDLEAGFMTTAGADALLDLAHSAFRAGQTFVQWSKSMLQRFGESIRQWLAGAWDHAKRSSQTGAVNFTGRLGSDLQKAASKAKASGPATSNQQPASSLQPAYMAAMQGRSSAMVPIKDVYAQAKAQNPNLTPEQFLAEVQAGDNAGTVLLEPFDTPQGLQAAGPFVVRNGSGVPSINMLVQRGFTHLDVSGQASQRGAVQFDSRTVDETRSRFASPREEDRQYETRADEAVLAEAEQYLDSVSVEAAVDAFVNGTVPLSGDAMVRAASRLLLRLNTATTAGTEVQRMWAHVQSQRMGRAWTSRVMSQDPARMLRQRAVANTDLISIAPILAAQEVLIDRADAVMDKRFDGGAEGAVEKVKEVIKNVDAQAGETLAGQLDTEMEEAPELGDNTDLQTGPDPRIADLEARLKELRTQMAAGDAAMQETTSTWQKILELLNAASQRKSAMLNGARSSLALARKAAQNRKAQRRAEGRLNANPVEDFADDAIIGTSFLAEGIVEFFNWGQAMIREIGARSNTELKQLYAAASKNYLDALKAEQAKPKKPTGKRTPARDKINKAQRTAQSILDELSRRYSDPPIFAEGQRKVNAMRELYKEHVKNPMAESTFVTRAQELGANAGTAGTLWEAANLEIDAREIMTREAMRAKLNPLLAQNSPALAKLLNSLRAKMFPGMKWADIFMELPSTQKDRQIEIYRRLKLDERLQSLTPEDRLALTNELDKAWQRERRKVFNRELKKAGVIGEKDASDRAKVEKALPKLLRMINLGMFNSEMWREAVAPEYGLKMLTSADTAQLRTLAEAAWKLPEGVLRNQKLRDLLNGIQKKTGASWIEVLNSYWTAAVLSGLRTQFDTWLAAVNGMGTNLMQIGGLIARGRGKAAIDAHAQWWRGLIEGVRESGQILFKGDTSYLKRFGADLMKALEGETSVTPVPMGENLWRSPDAKTAAGRAFQKYGLAPVMMFTGRLMAAADHINNTATTQGAIAVARALHPELYQGRVGFTEAERANARTQALREVTGGREPQTAQERATLSARVRELLNGSVSKQDYADSSEIGDMAAFQNDPTGVFGIVYSAMKQGLGSIQRGLGNYAEDVTANRFARVASGIMAGSLHGITGTRFMRFGANFGAEMTRYIPGSYVLLGKAGFYGRNVSRMQQELLLGKNLVGLMIGSTLAAVFLAGDDDDEGWQIEGDWSTLTPQEAKARMAAGYERMTMWKRDGDKIRRISYKQWPTMGLFSVVGGMLDEKRHKPAQWAAHGTSGHLLRGLATGYVQVKNVSAVRNLVELFGDPAFSADGVTGAIDKFVKTSSNFAGGLVPTLVKDADIWSDPRNFKPEGVAEQFLRSVPIARKYINDGRPQLNLLGEEVKLQRSPWSRAYTSVESAEAHRVLGALMARGLSLPMPSDQIHVFKDGIKVPLETLGREAVWKYEKAVGQAYKEWLNLEGSDLLKLPVKQADAVIKRRAEAIKSRAKAAVTR